MRGRPQLTCLEGWNFNLVDALLTVLDLHTQSPVCFRQRAVCSTRAFARIAAPTSRALWRAWTWTECGRRCSATETQCSSLWDTSTKGRGWIFCRVSCRWARLGRDPRTTPSDNCCSAQSTRRTDPCPRSTLQAASLSCTPPGRRICCSALRTNLQQNKKKYFTWTDSFFLILLINFEGDFIFIARRATHSRICAVYNGAYLQCAIGYRTYHKI